MDCIIILFPKIEVGNKIRNALIRNGYDAVSICTTGAQALNEMNMRDGGILISAYRLSDMFYTNILECLPSNFDFLLMLPKNGAEIGREDGIVTLSMPVSVFELVNTVQMMMQKRRKVKKRRPIKQRSESEKKVIEDAKALLIERNHMTEEEAHHYIQKCSMDTGRNMIETAEMITTLMNN